MKAKDKLQKASKRASETSEQTVHRQQQNRKHMASMRATETIEQRREKDRSNKASMRASIDKRIESTWQAREQLKKQAMCLYNKLLCHYILISRMDPILFAHVANV